MKHQSEKVSIIILNYNSWQITIECISNIEEQIEYENLEVIIVDNCSKNDSYERLSDYLENNELKYNYHLIKSHKNNGYASGNNIGIKQSIELKSKYSFIINNDILFTQSNTIQKFVRFMESKEAVGAISPRIISKDGYHDKPIYYKKPSFWDMTFGIKSFMRKRKLQNDELIYEIYAPRGSCMFLRNSCLLEIGFLDEGTFLYYEEPILAERLLRIGKSCFNFGEVCVIHNHASTIKNNVSRAKSREILVESLNYYLTEYRDFNFLQKQISILVRKYAYLISNK